MISLWSTAVLLIQTILVIVYNVDSSLILISILLVGIIEQISSIFKILLIPKDRFPKTKMKYVEDKPGNGAIPLQDPHPNKIRTTLIYCIPILVTLIFFSPLIDEGFATIKEVINLFEDSFWLITFLSPLIIYEVYEIYNFRKISQERSRLANGRSIQNMYNQSYIPLLTILVVVILVATLGERIAILTYFLIRWALILVSIKLNREKLSFKLSNPFGVQTESIKKQ